MDLVSIETPSENDLIEELISGGMKMLHTHSSTMCDFHDFGLT